MILARLAWCSHGIKATDKHRKVNGSDAMKKQSPKEIERENARKELLEILKPGDTVYCVLRHVSRSGMQREISLFVRGEHAEKFPDQAIRNIDWYAARLLDMRRGKRDGLVVGGCGMDMGFHLVYTLSRVLFADSFICIGEKCPANDHSNGDRDYTPHKHSDGGYALNHRWI